MKLPRPLLLSLALLLGLHAAPTPGAGQEAPAPQKPVAVFLLRHAETAAPTGGGNDPDLSPPGQERAQSLARLLGKAGVTHLYASEFQRTRATLAPLAAALDLEVETVPAGDPARQTAALRALPPGSVAVVAGHSNTVPALVHALGGELGELAEHPTYGRVFDDSAYDRLVQLILPPGPGAAPQTIELRYGD